MTNKELEEVLEDLKELHKLAYGNDKTSWKIDDIRMSSHIKQALTTKSEKEQVVEIIKEKNVDIALLKECKNKSEYNIEVISHNENLIKPLEWWTKGQLTQEEFDLLKEVLKNED